MDGVAGRVTGVGCKQVSFAKTVNPLMHEGNARVRHSGPKKGFDIHTRSHTLGPT
jgi:hypothetical protein